MALSDASVVLAPLSVVISNGAEAMVPALKTRTWLARPATMSVATSHLLKSVPVVLARATLAVSAMARSVVSLASARLPAVTSSDAKPTAAAQRTAPSNAVPWTTLAAPSHRLLLHFKLAASTLAAPIRLIVAPAVLVNPLATFRKSGAANFSPL